MLEVRKRVFLKSPVREICTPGSVPGAMGDYRLYGDYAIRIKRNKNVRLKMRLKERLIIVIPLIIVSAIFLIIHQYRAYDGLWLNLATEICGIVITVIYIEIIFERNNKEKWMLVDKGINERICNLTNALVSSLRIAQGSKYKESFETEFLYKNLKVDNKMTVNLINWYIRILVPSQADDFNEMKVTEWNLLIKNWVNANNSALDLQKMYGAIASPDQIETLMYLSNKTSSVVNLYSTFYDIIPYDAERISNWYVDDTEERRLILIELIRKNINEIIEYMLEKLKNL